VDRYKYVSKEGINDRRLVLPVVNGLNVIEGGAQKATSAEGQSLATGNVWVDSGGKNMALIFYRGMETGPRSLHFGRTFEAPDDTTGARGWSVRRYRDEPRKGSVIEVSTLRDWKLVAVDGSGLSRYNYVTADTLTTVLERMYRDPRHRDVGSDETDDPRVNVPSAARRGRPIARRVRRGKERLRRVRRPKLRDVGQARRGQGRQLAHALEVRRRELERARVVGVRRLRQHPHRLGIARRRSQHGGSSRKREGAGPRRPVGRGRRRNRESLVLVGGVSRSQSSSSPWGAVAPPRRDAPPVSLTLRFSLGVGV